MNKKEYMKNYCQINRIRLNQNKKIYYLKNKKRLLKKQKDYYKNHKECSREYRKINKKRIKIYHKQYNVLNRVKLNEYDKKYYKKRKAVITVRIAKNLRNRIYKAIKGINKSKSSLKLLGCSLINFKCYFECKFTPGMSWDKIMNGEIHIDHIRPCVSFDLSKPGEQVKCFHYANLQPLWAKDNLEKYNK